MGHGTPCPFLLQHCLVYMNPIGRMIMGREIGKLYQDPIYGAKVLSRLAVTSLIARSFSVSQG